MHGVILPERHFPEPWSVEELDACFVVKDLNGQALAHMYFEKESRHRHRRSELLTRDEALIRQRGRTITAKKAPLSAARGQSAIETLRAMGCRYRAQSDVA
jgi:hypothetical protein